MMAYTAGMYNIRRLSEHCGIRSAACLERVVDAHLPLFAANGVVSGRPSKGKAWVEGWLYVPTVEYDIDGGQYDGLGRRLDEPLRGSRRGTYDDGTHACNEPSYSMRVPIHAI